MPVIVSSEDFAHKHFFFFIVLSDEKGIFLLFIVLRTRREIFSVCDFFFFHRVV